MQARSVEVKFDPAGAAAREYRDLLVRFVDSVKSAGAQTAIMIYPQLHDVDGSSARYPQGDLLDFVVQICSSQNITCLDLRSVLASVDPAGKLWANRLDSHPVALANELVAEALIRTLRSAWVKNQSPTADDRHGAAFE